MNCVAVVLKKMRPFYGEQYIAGLFEDSHETPLGQLDETQFKDGKLHLVTKGVQLGLCLLGFW